MQSIKRDFYLRLILAGTLGGLLVVALAIKGQIETSMAVSQVYQEELVKVLRTYFPSSDLGGPAGLEPSVNQIVRRIGEFNRIHGPDPVADTAADTGRTLLNVVRVAEIEAPKHAIRKGIAFEVAIPGETGDVVVALGAIVPRQPKLAHVVALALFMIMAGALIALWPRAHEYNRYPLARDLAVIFDRKVSAGECWGFYRLSHLGGGGHLPGIASNNWDACNHPETREKCFADIQSAAALVESGLRDTRSPAARESNLLEILRSGLARVKGRLIRDAPLVQCQEDVTEVFRPYVREDLFEFILLPIHSASWLATVTGCASQRIDIAPPPLWLIGGYEIYFPKDWFVDLVGEIDGGFLSAYSASFDRISVAAHPRTPYINIDFSCGNADLGLSDAGRLQQYLRTPYKGGLSRMVQYMDGCGDIQIIGSSGGFDLTALRKVAARSTNGVAVRLSFRRVAPWELEPLRRAINNSVRVS